MICFEHDYNRFKTTICTIQNVRNNYVIYARDIWTLRISNYLFVAIVDCLNDGDFSMAG